MTQTLLIEIGVEELPAVPLLKELNNIEKKWAKVLEEKSLLCEFEFYYTPRRLVLWHREFQSSQSDSVEEFFGAPVAIAFDKEGKPTKACEGFARKCGVSVDDLGRNEKGGKEVLYFKKEIKGQASKLLLNEMINEFMKSLNFGKSMRWGSLSDSFIRPIRWLNVMMGNQSVEAQLYGVPSAKTTYLHRIASFDAQDVPSAEAYFEMLKEGAVSLFPEDRQQDILEDFTQIEKDNDLVIQRDEELLDEVVAITENPKALLGSFDEAFLRLPPEVIITSMKEHQRYFPVFKDTVLTNKFVVVSNALTNDYSKVIEGNEKVLRPRLADGLFFYDNDLKRGLVNDGLEKVTFIKGLGSLLDKIQREKKIALILAKAYGVDEKKVERSVELSKADLMSEMVFEFTDLQGVMGTYYAQAQNEDEDVALAIKEQYLPKGESPELPTTKVSAILALATKLDTLIGLFSVEQIPTGSRDPFALRRAVNGIIRIVNEFKFDFDISAIKEMFSSEYKDFDYDKLQGFILERINQFYKVNPSVIKAVIAADELSLCVLDAKIKALHTIVSSDSFSESFSTFKRVANITKDVNMEGNLSVTTELFEEEAEKNLHKAYTEVVSKKYESFEAHLDALFSLKPHLDAFFDKVMVNVDDEKIKTNRKNLVSSVYKSFKAIADIKEISI
ncbi:glycine--tRNA ligase subunit beta [Sulfurimonas sp. MAG313]|nr:glycine--tRNA ligase subunit beta [Sulfurimonas sp. MAG313]MDF1880565.1 glycine--tRNA ligase subunit beta [Sulfurimonas sp. MAG313]